MNKDSRNEMGRNWTSLTSLRSDQWVYVAKGIGICLVVMGHLYVPESQPEYWLWGRTVIYMVHMPLFMLLSGFLYGLHEPKFDTGKNYGSFVKKKAVRLMIPYVFITSVMIIIKYTAGFLVPLRHRLDENFLYYALLNPMGKLTPDGGFATFLWFIYTLFVIFLLFPILRKLLGNGLVLVFSALLLSLLPWPKSFCLRLAFQFMPMFAFGFYLSSRNGGMWPNILPGLLGGIGFVALAYIGYEPPENEITRRLLYTARGICGSLFVLYIARIAFETRWRIGRLTKIFLAFGRYSPVIYLVHIIAMGPFTVLLYGVFSVGSSQFLLVAPVIWSIGLFGPIVFERLVLSRSPILARLVLGSVVPDTQQSQARLAAITGPQNQSLSEPSRSSASGGRV